MYLYARFHAAYHSLKPVLCQLEKHLFYQVHKLRTKRTKVAYEAAVDNQVKVRIDEFSQMKSKVKSKHAFRTFYSEEHDRYSLGMKTALQLVLQADSDEVQQRVCHRSVKKRHKRPKPDSFPAQMTRLHEILSIPLHLYRLETKKTVPVKYILNITVAGKGLLQEDLDTVKLVKKQRYVPD